jgi:hypothetical protein
MKPLVQGFLLGVVMLAAPIASATPATDSQVDTLLDVMRTRQTLEAVLPQIRGSQQQMVEQLTAGKTLSDEQRKKLSRYLDKSSSRIAEVLAWENMRPVYRDIYRQTFSAEDIDAMVTFYSSPAGRNLLDKMPQLMQNSMNAVQKVLVPVLQDLQKDIEAGAVESPEGK